jgi:hypothetical protein
MLRSDEHGYIVETCKHSFAQCVVKIGFVRHPEALISRQRFYVVIRGKRCQCPQRFPAQHGFWAWFFLGSLRQQPFGGFLESGIPKTMGLNTKIIKMV